ncbi:MAG: hypothetical protein ACXW5U_06835 [Thermoanaerobaculia bacterium]
MPAPSISLPPNLAKRLSRVRTLAGASQVQLAKEAEVAQGTVSNLLQGNASRPIGANYARAIVVAIQAAVESHVAGAKLTDELANELRRPVAEALAFVEDSTEERPRIALPGGAMHPDARNRVVRREYDDLLVRGLDSHPAMMCIVGSPQSGKSTLLRFAELAATNRGMNVTYFDDAALDTSIKDAGGEHFFLRLVRELAVSWGEEAPPEVSTGNDLKDFVMRTRKRSAPASAIAIVDVPSDLPSVAQEDLVEACRVLKSHASDLNLSWLLALQPPCERKNNWFRSSGGYFYPILRLKGFSESEVREFLQHYPKAAENIELLSWLMHLFGGQPFLTHVALERIDQGEARESVENLALQRSDSFGLHVARMEEAIGADLVSALRQSSTDDPTDDDDRKFLSDMDIVTFEVDSNGATRRNWVSRLYENCFGLRRSVQS